MDDTIVFRVGLRMYVALVGGVEDIGYDRIFIYPLALRFDKTFDGNTLRWIGMVTVGPMALHRGCGGPRVVSRFLMQSPSRERTQRLKHC